MAKRHMFLVLAICASIATSAAEDANAPLNWRELSRPYQAVTEQLYHSEGYNVRLTARYMSFSCALNQQRPASGPI